MTLAAWRRLAALLVLALFVSLYLAPDWWSDGGRRAVMISQLTANAFGDLGVRIHLFVLFLFLAVTQYYGRLYCSILCPAGLVQELFFRIGRRLGLTKKMRRVPPGPQIAVMAATALLLLCGIMEIGNFLDPTGLFGRLAVSRRIWPSLDQPFGDDAAGSLVVISAIIAGAVLLVIVPLFFGRWHCDRLCPVGGFFGVLAARKGRRVAIDETKCVSCGTCEKICPTRCADAAGKSIDPARCVVCLDCLDACAFKAISYRDSAPRPPVPATVGATAAARRTFLGRGALAAAAMYIVSRPAGAILGFNPLVRAGENAIAPPGANPMHRHLCIGCQACVAACPVAIITPTGSDLRPVLDYNRGYCQYNCAACADTCPAGALVPTPMEKKRRLRIAETELRLGRCIVIVNSTACGACAEVCPTHAVRMIPAEDGGPTVPDFDSDYCIGCGACYHVCPAEPRAFVISPVRVQLPTAGVRPGGHGDVDEEAWEPPTADEEGLQDFPF